MAVVAEPLPSASRPSTRPSREEIAKFEIGLTDISCGKAWFLTLMFLVSIYAVPAAEHAAVLRQYSKGETLSAMPRCYELESVWTDAVEAYGATNGSAFHRVLKANRAATNRMEQYERQLEDESLFVQTVLPPTQSALVRFLNVGNGQAYVGKYGWLYYRPEIEYITGPPFLAPRQLRKRRHENPSEAQVQPEPREAICQFHAQLASRGIRLIVMPTPVKPTIHPERFSTHFRDSHTPINNSSYDDFITDLEQRGILVFDPTEAFMSAKSSTVPLYLATDTHWSPQAMKLAGRELAHWITERNLLPTSIAAEYRSESKAVRNTGDIARMLRLRKRSNLLPRQRVVIEQVSDNAGRLWSSSPSADILFLGDSFSNIYSAGSMGWGRSAGFVEQLSYYLRRPLDRITQNDDGAFATRQKLSRRLARGDDRLFGKRIVIWQFAARELAVGDWKLIDMQLRQKPVARFLAVPSGGELTVSGSVKAVSPAARPREVPYKDHILSMHLTHVVVESSGEKTAALAGDQCIAYLWSMRDNITQPAARIVPGQRVKLRLRSWADVIEDYETINRSELDDFALQLEEPNWGVVIE